ncbi:MAG TPA: glycosyltransferase family 1 protein [Flavobacterium sp.]|nr:glycosyltransferase family 1 protein [Flavobacterium sp.]
MDKPRKRVGIFFIFNPKWMGGVIYILNAIKVLNYLEDKDKPIIYVFYNPNLERFLEELDYPYLEKVLSTYPSVYNGFLKSLFTRRNVFVEDLITTYKLDSIFPLHDFPVRTKLNCKLISWYADLQHMHYPQFFSKAKRLERYLRVQFILKNADHLVVSSEAVRDDFHRFFKIPKSLNFHTYHFVSIIDKFPEHSLAELKTQYNLPDDYFIICNQFHKHKNHKVAFQAVAALKKKGIRINLVLTGKLPEDAKSVYLQELRNILAENQLEDQIIFLGVLPRDVQLSIMKHSLAIIQPSLFEGWSTVNEDAIALQKPVICSDLIVNIEQMKDKGYYFSPHDDAKLMQILSENNFKEIQQPIYESYESRVTHAAKTLHKILTT